MSILLESPDFSPGGAIPSRFTADGRNLSPGLRWSGVSEQARELALIVDDPDAPAREPWVHWVIYKIPAMMIALPEAVPTNATLPQLHGAFQGKNSWGQLGYGGPAPPKGHGVHHYHFKLFALDAALDVFHGLTKAQLLHAMQGHVLEQGELVGTYSR
jgi:Raf kinase inhibitor-like YbhB/YbcL family protein